jgi:serine/threonine-protein kinase
VHENGSIHRDIKPSNIMRDRNGKLYLLDFGAVKQVAKVAASAAKGSTGIYSMGFAPPEQMAGGEVYPSTDLYALAVTVVMLLTGKEATELFDAYSNQWNWRRQATVSKALADVLDRMLLSAPNQRFQSADEVMVALNPTKTPVPFQPLSRPVATSPPPTPSTPPTPRPTFSTLELLTGAAFSGFEGALIAIALYSLLQSQSITLGVSALILGVVIFAQFRRWIEKWEMLIIAGFTLAIVLLIPALHKGSDIQAIAFLAVAAGLIAIALTALFRLIYNLLTQIF